MDENLSWKIVIVASVFSLIVMGVVYYFISPTESPYFTEEKMEKIAEFKNTRVSGHKEGKKIWEFFAKEGWTSANREIHYLIDVSEGNIYIDNELVVADLAAPRAKVFRRTDIVEVKGPVRARLDLGMASTQKKDRSQWTRMKTDYLKYIPDQKRSELEENVELHKKDSSIYADKVLIDHKERKASISKNIRLKRKDGTLRSDSVEYFGPREELKADGNVFLNITEANLKTKLKANHAAFYSDMNKEMTLRGSLEVVQGKKLAIANWGLYSQKDRGLKLKGAVKTVFEKAAALIKDDTAEKLKSKEAKEILKEKTILTADEVIFFTHTGDASASGSVLVAQQTREAKADHADYNERKEILNLTGNVFLKKEGKWVRAKEIIISIKDETFTAIGSVEAEFKL